MVTKKIFHEHERKAFAGGILVGGIFLLLTFFARLFGIFGETTNILFDIYGKIGYDISFFGIILGGAYGFVTGFILSYVHSWISNKL
jgi:hypothetical protein